MKVKILWIEGKRADGPSFIPSVRKHGYEVEAVTTGSAAIGRIPEYKPDLLLLNVSSLRSSGRRICSTLFEHARPAPILVIINEGKSTHWYACANIVLQLPFTSRKLLNSLELLTPWENANLLEKGPIALDLKRNRVRCQGLESHLTPSVVKLLRTLMDHPGEVLERERLFREVWDTEYTEDTRTLDVHISWLRQAIETNPREPKYLKTIRGVGYRLDI